METLAQPETASSSITEPELHLIRERKIDPADRKRTREAAVGSICFHLALIATLLVIPESPARPVPEPETPFHITPLYTPPDLTQKAPNKGKISKELTAESIAPHPRINAPSPAPAARRNMPPPPIQVAQNKPNPVVIEAPKIQIQNPVPLDSNPALKIAPPPPAPVEAPKLALQSVAPPPQGPVRGNRNTGIAAPNPSVQEAIRNLSHNAAGAGQAVGDVDIDEGGSGLGLNLPPSAGRPRSSLELKSDPMGVDFRPYLLQVLAAVRRNWFAVYPEAARLGQRGTVSLQFAIAKDGLVTKIVFSTESGAKALDQAAVAAISASNRFPPLPTGYKGDRVVLQMNFLYNMPR